ncbi:MAG: thiamine pyrophosphate-binding protein, partial [Actinomycetes bacterium]
MSGAPRTGGDLVVESLAALGARTVFGVPGQHALGTFSALSRSALRYIGLRTELSAAFAADGYARTTGDPATLLVSTGPGALISLAALQEAAASSVPVVTVSSQVPRAGLGGLRKGYLHELRDQRASVRDVVKSATVVTQPGQLPSALAEAWETALTPPYGPTWVEVPQDVLLGPAGVPAVTHLAAAPRMPQPRTELLDEAARLLAGARRPVVLA